MTAPDTRGTVNVFVAPDGNGFMRDIASWLVEAAGQLHWSSRLVTDRLPRPDGSINLVVAPHEFYLLRGDAAVDVGRAASVSVPVCTEQPGTPWFELSLGYCVGSPLVLDINATAVAAIEREGFVVRHLPLGAVPSMDRRRFVGERDLDVVFLGGDTPYRSEHLARLAPHVWDLRSEFRLFPTLQPITGDEPGIVLGADKYDLLARSRVLVNIHRDDAEHGYFEWARMIEAMANGCVVVSQPSTGHEPLVPGIHFVETDDPGPAVRSLLEDQERLDRIAAAAHRFVVDDHPLYRSLAPLLDEVAVLDLSGSSTVRARRRFRRPPAPDRPRLSLPVFGPHRDMRARIYRAVLAETNLQRRIDAVRCRLRHGSPDHVETIRTAGYESVDPEVTVVVTLYNYAELVVETLDSVLASTDVRFEVVIVDDHSTDGGRQAVTEYMERHPDVAMMLIGCDANHGLPTARNLAFEAARAERVMVMDADNLVYPNCLRVLLDALEDDPDAVFAYAMLEDFGVRPGVRSALGWWPPWLCRGNYIDAQAMVRVDAWRRHGGYRHDEGCYGWEDWDLWLRFAAAGERAVHVPRMLGRYRTQHGSMISVTELAAPELRSHLRSLYPDLPWPD
jgi:hypothetical protein